MIPEYESEEDVLAALDVAACVENSWKCSAFRLPPLSVVDFALCDAGVLKAFAEVKVRDNAHDAYDEYMISLVKWSVLYELTTMTKSPAFLVVKFTDGLYYTKITEKPFRVARGGREDRGDTQDKELCAFVPMKLFKEIK